MTISIVRLLRRSPGRALVFTILLVVAPLLISQLTPGMGTLGQQSISFSPLAQQATSPSWNPASSCKAVVLTVEQFLGNVPNPTQTKPNAGADYSGGALPLE